MLVKKEFIQMARDLKVFWLPLVFVFLGITQPIVSYYLPTILKMVGGGQGITIDPTMPVQQGAEVLASTLVSQFDQLGIMIIVISMMAVVQTDKANGMLAFILTRPVTVRSYISGKIVSNYILLAGSVSLGYLTSYLYVNYLFSNVAVINMIVALLFYLLWVLFMVSFTTMISTIFNSPAVIALLSIAFLFFSRIIVGLSVAIDFINPASMSNYALEMLMIGTVNTDVIWSVLMTFVMIGFTMIITNFWIAHKKYVTD